MHLENYSAVIKPSQTALASLHIGKRHLEKNRMCLYLYLVFRHVLTQKHFKHKNKMYDGFDFKLHGLDDCLKGVVICIVYILLE